MPANMLKILIVDDDPGWLEELTRLLSSANYHVETVSSFKLARERLPRVAYAAIIIDLELESGDVPQVFEGFGLLSGVRFLDELPRNQGKAIVVSAYGTLEHVREAFKCGAYDFIQKQGFDEDKFLNSVQEAVELWGSSRAEIQERGLSPEEKRQYERAVRAQIIQFDMPNDAVNPWEKGAP